LGIYLGDPNMLSRLGEAADSQSKAKIGHCAKDQRHAHGSDAITRQALIPFGSRL
jgi:hypothetical protein